MRLVTLTVVVALVGSFTGTAAAADGDELVARASAYVVDFLNRLSNVVAEEHYVQETTSPHRHRDLRSDFLLVKPPGLDEWLQFRDTYEVDGRSVRDRDARLSRLFLEEPQNALARAVEVVREGSRFNLEEIGTLNKPLLALSYLQPRYAGRFRLVVGPVDKDVGAGVRLVQFTEIARPTLLQGSTANRDLPSRGGWWIEERTGRVVKTELRVVATQITTTFGVDDDLKLAVPVAMRERYQFRFSELTSVATYGRFRRFEVRTEEQVR